MFAANVPLHPLLKAGWMIRQNIFGYQPVFMLFNIVFQKLVRYNNILPDKLIKVLCSIMVELKESLLPTRDLIEKAHTVSSISLFAVFSYSISLFHCSPDDIVKRCSTIKSFFVRY